MKSKVSGAGSVAKNLNDVPLKRDMRLLKLFVLARKFFSTLFMFASALLFSSDPSQVSTQVSCKFGITPKVKKLESPSQLPISRPLVLLKPWPPLTCQLRKMRNQFSA